MRTHAPQCAGSQAAGCRLQRKVAPRQISPGWLSGPAVQCPLCFLPAVHNFGEGPSKQRAIPHRAQRNLDEQARDDYLRFQAKGQWVLGPLQQNGQGSEQAGRAALRRSHPGTAARHRRAYARRCAIKSSTCQCAGLKRRRPSGKVLTEHPPEQCTYAHCAGRGLCRTAHRASQLFSLTMGLAPAATMAASPQRRAPKRPSRGSLVAVVCFPGRTGLPTGRENRVKSSSNGKRRSREKRRGALLISSKPPWVKCWLGGAAQTLDGLFF